MAKKKEIELKPRKAFDFELNQFPEKSRVLYTDRENDTITYLMVCAKTTLEKMSDCEFELQLVEHETPEWKRHSFNLAVATNEILRLIYIAQCLKIIIEVDYLRRVCNFVSTLKH